MARHLRAVVTLALLGAAAAGIQSEAAAAPGIGDWREIRFPPVKAFAVPKPERFVMKNGVVVLLMEDHELPMVAVQGRIRTGSRLEPAGKIGLASIMAQVLRTGGAGGRAGDEIDDFLDARGARIETGMGVDWGTATMSCLNTSFPEVLRVFVDILRTPAFAEAKIAVAKNQARAGISRRNDDPLPLMFREADRLVYGPESPYARISEYATIDSIQREDIIAFHGKFYLPNRLFLGVVGDFDSKEMRALLEKALGGWSRGPQAKDPEATYRTAPAPGIYRIAKKDMTQSAVIVAHIGIRQDNPDYFAASMMNQILSGSSGARLPRHVRTEKGLAYAVGGSLGSDLDHPGTFTMWLTTKTETTATAIDALLAEVDDLVKNPPTDDELSHSRQAILNSFFFNYESKSLILNDQLAYEYFGYPPDFLSRFRENIEKVTAADVARVARTYVKREDLAILVVGKTEGLDRPLDSFGAVTNVDIAIPEATGAP